MKRVVTPTVVVSLMLASHLGYSQSTADQSPNSSPVPVRSSTLPPAPPPPSGPPERSEDSTPPANPTPQVITEQPPPPAPAPNVAPPANALGQAAPSSAGSADARGANAEKARRTSSNSTETAAAGRAIAESQEGTPSTDEGTEEANEDAPETVLEDPEPSQGHFIALGVHGVGAMAFDDHRGTRTPTFGPGFSLRFGQSVTDWLDLSLAFALATTSGDVDDSMTFGRFGVQSQWYLSDRVFVQAGFGATNGQGTDPEDHDLLRGRYGDVYLTGVGYNLYLSDNDSSGGWVLTPVLTAEVGPDRTFTTTALWLGLEVSWWTGLTRDKLHLPLSKAYDRSSE